MQQVRELLLGQPRLADQGAQSPFGEFPMIRHRQPALGRMPQNNVAAGLMIHFVAQLTERLDRVRAGSHRQTAHAGTSTTSSLTGSGTASPCFSRLKM